ncbi:MAG: hypothetical protein WA652_08590 [Xanthobacteraceae bacterium]|jgi:hypothetical protein
MLAGNDEVRQRLLRVLTGHPNGYRPAISPADLIEQHRPVQTSESVSSFGEALRKLFRSAPRR